LQRDDAVLVPIAGIAEQAIFVHAALGEIDGAGSSGGVFCAAYRLARFCRRVDVRNEHAVGAHVQRLLNAAAIVKTLDAHERFCTAVSDSGKHGGKALVAHWAVLGVHKKPVVAAVGELFRDGGTM